jgi:photosystem II stability/assembly factor-like uncharacterized protein
MPDLAEDIRALIEGGIRPLDLADIPRDITTYQEHHNESDGFGAALSGRPQVARFIPRRGRTILISVAAAVVVLGAIGLTLTARTTTTTPNTSAPPESQSWSLVGDISQAGWQVENTPASGSQSLVCMTASTCYADGNSSDPVAPGSTPTFPQTVIEVTHDGGTTWTSSVPAPGIELVSSLTCAATNTCMIAGAPASPSATDHIYITTNGGQTWTSNPMPTESEGDVELSCTTASTCVALEHRAEQRGVANGSDVFTTFDGGQNWTTTPLSDGFWSYSLQCSAGGHCVAVGDTVSPSGTTTSLPTATALYSVDGGRTWSASTLPADNSGYPLISAVSCGDAEHCLAVEPLYLPNNRHSQVLISGNGGATWTPSNYSSPDPVSLANISCPTRSDCWATGGRFISISGPNAQRVVSQGYIMATHDGGHTWTPEQVPSDQGVTPDYVGSISCATANACSALAQAPNAGDWVFLSDQPTRSSN